MNNNNFPNEGKAYRALAHINRTVLY
uniref:Uncharacterized protein n=1 Tax=Rhizophora mucronata TaxID=61149 RepID=A0A2P2J2X4_RHIMU